MPAPDRRSRRHRRSLWPLTAVLLILAVDYALVRTLVLDRVMLLTRGQRGVARVVERNSQFTREPRTFYSHPNYAVTYTFQVRTRAYGHRQAVDKGDFEAMRKGAEVEIVYDPGNPRNSTLAGSVQPLGVALSAAVLLAANAAAGLAWRARRRVQRRPVHKGSGP